MGCATPSRMPAVGRLGAKRLRRRWQDERFFGLTGLTMGNTKCTLDDDLVAIEGSYGDKTAIGKRLGVCRQTVTSYLKRWASADKAYQEELEGVLDMAESLVAGNIKLGLGKQQEELAPVDSSDARWILRMKGRQRGYAETQRHEIEDVDRAIERELARVAASRKAAVSGDTEAD